MSVVSGTLRMRARVALEQLYSDQDTRGFYVYIRVRMRCYCKTHTIAHHNLFKLKES